MMDWDEATQDLLQLVLRRRNLLASLQDGPKRKPALVDELAISRSTVDRAVRDLESASVVAYVDGGYETTTFGDVVVRHAAQLGETVSTGRELTPFFRWLSADEFDLDPRHLADAELLVPEPNDPYAMIHRHVALVEDATRQRYVLPLVGRHAMEAAHEAVLEEGAESTAVVSPGVVETYRSDPAYAELYADLAAVDRYRVYEYDGEIPFFVGIFDGTVQIGVDDDGEPRAIVESTADEVLDWAEDTFEEFKQAATRVA